MNPPGAAAATQAAEDALEYPSGLHPPTRRRRAHGLIGDAIVALGFASRDTVDAAAATSRQTGRMTGQLLVESGAISSEQLARALAEHCAVDFIALGAFEVDSRAIDLLDVEVAKRYQALPVGFLADRTLVVAMADPTNVLTIDEISMITGHRVRPAAAPHEDLTALIARLGLPDEPAPTVEETDLAIDEPVRDDAPVVRLVHKVIANAIQLGASDIHCDPEAGDLRVQFRIDGVLTPATTVARTMAAEVVSRIKIMASLDIAERRQPQDGRMAVNVDGRRIDLRVVTLPLIGGEGVVMRILDTGAVIRDLELLGMHGHERERFENAIHKPYGAVLVTGPTGSGKSTTLYSALKLVNDGQRSILTIEDPAESAIPGIKQMQVSIKAGVTFAAGLRSILRADPDVIMVGEIRDRETAEIAIQAALTGHLMLSTLHTRDAASALTRLVDMRIEPFMVAAAIDCVVAQRLARVLCNECKRPAELSATVLAEQGLEGAEVYEPAGCFRCGYTGYHGRTGVYEVMTVTDEIRALLRDHAGVESIAEAAIAHGMRTMRADGIQKVRAGITSLVEVGRVTTTV